MIASTSEAPDELQRNKITNVQSVWWPFTTAHFTLISPSFPVSTSMAPVRTMAAAYFFAQPLGFSANDATLATVRELPHRVWSEVKSPLPLCRFL
ncbi:unnamed protein product [Spirodela intermedia]|uniref:Uncharacterized protein n=1 Tax=Spirodela intermedia TaxID=51605 RepID=A0A7I8J0H1_SPIIN|nr:unnamed protein product [Spirodela intermedia]CAA6663628.1 unnamed protein product [Spirodela intermedia]